MAVSCLSEALRARRAMFASTETAAPTAIGPAEAVIYAAMPLSFNAAFRATPQFSRLLPVLLDASPSVVMLRGNNGLVDIDGRSASGCRVSASGLSPDPASGWYALPGERVRWRGRMVTGKPVPMVRFGANGIDFSAEAQAKGMLTCPAGAKFDAMRPIPAPVAVVHYLWGK